jgi:hypothetical protein
MIIPPYAGVAKVGGLEGLQPSNDTFLYRAGRRSLCRTGKGNFGEAPGTLWVWAPGPQTPPLREVSDQQNEHLYATFALYHASKQRSIAWISNDLWRLNNRIATELAPTSSIGSRIIRVFGRSEAYE